MKKFAALLLATAVAVAFVPATASAQNNDKKKINRFFKKLKSLENRASRPGKVNRFSTKLVKLDPERAKRYYRTAAFKYTLVLLERQLAKQKRVFDRVLNRAAAQGTISAAAQRRIERAIERVEERFEPTPTPTPYQASTSFSEFGLV